MKAADTNRNNHELRCIRSIRSRENHQRCPSMEPVTRADTVRRFSNPRKTLDATSIHFH